MKKYQLIWSEEFDYQGKPDPNKWTYDFGGHGFGNKEAQYYTDNEDNAYVRDGNLVITAKKEDFEDNHYTSAKIHTHGKFSFQHGRIAVRAKLPLGKGTWPAIWMLGDSIKQGCKWPLCGEIDVMEHTGRDPHKIHLSLHTKAYNHKLYNHRTHIEHIKEVFDEFVEYALDWEEDYIEYFINGKSIVRFDRYTRPKDNSEEGWPFNNPFYIILNLAIGGTFGGEIDDSIFPVSFLIDYVRVYKIINGKGK